MTTTYIIVTSMLTVCLAMMLVDAAIKLKGSDHRAISMLLIGATMVYVVMDILWIGEYVAADYSQLRFEVLNVLFYLIYITLPFVWCLFAKHFAGSHLTGRAWNFVLALPWLVNLVLVVLTACGTGLVWATGPADARYARGPAFDLFTILNLAYYIIPILGALVLIITGKGAERRMLAIILCFALIPAAGVYANAHLISLESIFPFQPCCFFVGVMFAYILLLSEVFRKAGEENLRLAREAELAEHAKVEALEHRLELQGKIVEQSQALKDALETAQQANRAKTTFLSNMSHEIRTPMNAIIGLNNIALADGETPEKTRGYLEKIDASAHHLLGIINDILDMSRIESGRMVVKNEEFSFQKTLEQVNTIIGGQCHDKGLAYDCHIQGRVAEYYIGDDMKLRQALINILGNAVKFTPTGGEVTLSIQEVAKFDGKSTLRFTVSDTGIGMSEEYLPHIFDAFSQEDSSTTNQYGSTGLGLSITKSIVELMNGHIEVESTKGEGSTFTVTVTLTESKRSDEGVDPALGLNPHELSVLVIDDDEIALEHAGVVLGQVGIACEAAASGAEGVEKVKVRHARHEAFDLILIDWKMPEMDGLATTRAIREVVGHDSAIIILTSYNWEDIEAEAKHAGVDSFVSKPLFASTVIDEFAEAFRKKNEALDRRTADLVGRRILLAEDVPVNAEIMMMVLGMREMEVDLAENGRIAVDLFAVSEPGHYDAILMDMRMPEMDGLEATRTIRAMNRVDAATVPIIALTANAFDEDVQRSLQAGLNAHLSKPVEPEVLFETLEHLIAESMTA